MSKLTIAVHKLASCDGCQLSVLDCEDELLAVADAVDIAYFPEASRRMLPGPWDVSLVEGSITTEHDRERIEEIRRLSGTLITIGACATAGGIQALRNLADVAEYTAQVYARPDFISTLATSTPVADHVPVDYALRGCPVDKHQLLEVLIAAVHGRPPAIPNESVCAECKRAGNVCVVVAQGTPCLGPVTHSGCGGLCPGFHRGCFGCFGPSARPNLQGITEVWRGLGASDRETRRALRTFNAAAPAFAEESARLEES